MIHWRPERRKYPAGGFHPIGSLGGLIKAWWDADTGLVDDGAGLISSWTDHVASIAATATTTARPTLGAASFNQRAGLTFDGTANCLVSTSISALPNGAAPGMIFCLFNDTGSTTGHVFDYGGSTAATDRTISIVGTAPARLMRNSDASTNLTVTAPTVAGKHVLGGAWVPDQEYAYVDGQSVRPASAAIATLNTGTTRLRIGSNNGAAGANFATGVLRHAIVTGRLLDFQRAQLVGWLAWDGGIPDRLPGNHPFRYRRP